MTDFYFVFFFNFILLMNTLKETIEENFYRDTRRCSRSVIVNGKPISSIAYIQPDTLLEIQKHSLRISKCIYTSTVHEPIYSDILTDRLRFIIYFCLHIYL